MGSSRTPRHVHTSSFASRPSPLSNGVRGGDLHLSTDPVPTVSIARVGATGLREWVDLTGVGVAGWAKYVVSNNPSIIAPYATISDAITGFVNDATATRAYILVHAGTFTENLTIPDGVYLTSFDQTRNRAVRVVGNVGFSPAGAATASLAGLNIVGSITFSGAQLQHLSINDCSIEPTAGACLTCNNSNVTSTLDVFDTDAVRADVGAAVKTNTKVLLTWNRGSIHASASSGIAVDATSTSFAFTAVDILGQVLTTLGLPSFDRCAQLVTGVSAQVLSGSTVSWSLGHIDSTFDPMVAGTGTWKPRLVGTDHVYTVAAGVTQTPLENAYQRIVGLFGAGATVLTNATQYDEVSISPAGTASTCVLPDVTVYPNARQLFIRNRSLTGTVAVSPAAGDTLGGLFAFASVVVQPGGLLSLLADPVNNTWQIDSTTGVPASESWGKYVVSNDTPITAPYTTIGAALLAFIADGGSSAQPAYILVHAGTYTENITLPDGAHIAAFDNTRDRSVILAGTVSFSPAGASSASLAGLNITGLITFGGTQLIHLTINNCKLETAAGPFLTASNTNVASTLDLFDTDGVRANVGAALNVTTQVALTWNRGSVSASASSGIAMTIPAGTYAFERVTVSGQVISATGTITFDYCTQTTTAVSAQALNSNSTIRWNYGAINCTFDPVVSGEGNWRPRLVGTNNIYTVAATVLQFPAETGYQRVVGLFAAGATVLTNATQYDEVQIAPAGGASTCDLPDVTVYPAARQLFVRNTSTTGTVEVSPAAGDTLGGAFAFASIVVQAGGLLSLLADPANNTWLVDSATAVPVPTSAWGKYVVSNDPEIVAPYATIGAALTQLQADGGQAFILVHAGTYAENVTLFPGVSLAAFSSPRNQSFSPTNTGGVVIAGDVTFSDVVGGAASITDIHIFGTLTVGGAAVLELTVDGCICQISGGAAAVVLSNTNALSLVQFVDVDAVQANAGVPAINTTGYVGAFNWSRGKLAGSASNDLAATLGASADTFSDIDITGKVNPTGGTHTLNSCRLTASTVSAMTLAGGAVVVWERGWINGNFDPVIAGAGTWKPRLVGKTTNYTVAATVTQTPGDAGYQNTLTAFSGAGPYVMTSANSADTIRVTPGNSDRELQLPDLTVFPDGRDMTIIHVEGAGAAGTITVSVIGASKINGSTGDVNQVLMYPGDALTLRADVVANVWRIENWTQFTPVSPTLFINQGAGSDLSSGTSTFPLASYAEARRRITTRGWTSNAFISFAAAHAETMGGMATPGGGIIGALPLFTIGHAAALAGTGSLQITARTAGSGSAFGTLTVVLTAALAANAGRTYWVRITDGAAAGARYPIYSSINGATTVITIDGTFSTLPAVNDHFVVERPDVVLTVGVSSALWTAGTGSVECLGIVAFDCRNINSVNGWIQDTHILMGACLLYNPSAAANTRVYVGSGGELTAGLGDQVVSGSPEQYRGLVAYQLLEFGVNGGTLSGSRIGVHYPLAGTISSVVWRAAKINIDSFGQAVDVPCINDVSLSNLIMSNSRICANTGGAGLPLDKGTIADLDQILVVDTGNTSGIRVNHGSFSEFSGITGAMTGADATGIELRNQSSARVTDPNTTTTIIGAIGQNYRLGTTVNDVWATIVGSSDNDLSATASSEICYIAGS